MTYTYELHIDLIIGSLQCLEYVYQSRSSNQRYENDKVKFIVNVQSLTQCGKGKWWRNQPRWLVRGTKQALVKRRRTMCELLGEVASIRGVFEISYISLIGRCNAMHQILYRVT